MKIVVTQRQVERLPLTLNMEAVYVSLLVADIFFLQF